MAPLEENVKDDELLMDPPEENVEECHQRWLGNVLGTLMNCTVETTI